MSERLKNTIQTSNEDIIDDLTKDFKSSLGTRENFEGTDIKGETSTEEVPTNRRDTGDTPKTAIPPLDVDIDQNYDYVENDKTSETSDTDSIDEVALKDAEVDLTDEQKEERRSIAEEYKFKGNDAFRVGDYEMSIEKYTEGLRICPLQYTQQRSILYCNRSASKMKLQNYDKAIKDCTKAIELDDKYLKAYLRRAQSYEVKEKYDESLADFKKVLELDPSNKEALKAVDRLPPLIEQKNEQLKNEMLGKLKDLGNMILKPFGLSTSNFQMEQDPETKGYKINFKQ